MNQALDRELSRLSQRAGSSQSSLLTEMVQYHLGLRKAGDRPGKRLRANIALLTCEAFGRRYADALWAAVAVELVHNFSLVFDDVQDHDELRRGRPSVWKVWGRARPSTRVPRLRRSSRAPSSICCRPAMPTARDRRFPCFPRRCSPSVAAR